jgi:inorganic pyrophosphatase
MRYPGNYGYVPDTLCEDGDAIDIIMPVDYTVHMGCVIKCKVIGVFIMEDDKGEDVKLLVMPANDVDTRFVDINDYSDLPKITVDTIEHFFQHYKDLTQKKVITKGFADRNVAEKYPEKSYEMYNSQ